MSSKDEDICVGDRLKYIRTDIPASQENFAYEIGVSLRAYQSYERGERPVTKDLLLGLYDKYRVNPLWVLTGEGDYDSRTAEGLDAGLFKEVVALVRSEHSELRGVSLDLILDEVLAIYSSASHSKTEREKELILQTQLNLMNQFALKGAIRNMRKAVSDYPETSSIGEPAIREMEHQLSGLKDAQARTNQTINGDAGQVAGRDIHNKK